MPRRANPHRAEARATAKPFYIGAPCRFGHMGERYTSTGACRDCVAAQPVRSRKPVARVADEFSLLMEG